MTPRVITRCQRITHELERRGLLFRVAQRLPQRLRYWALIVEGVDHIHADEVVPDVGFTVVLERSGKARS